MPTFVPDPDIAERDFNPPDDVEWWVEQFEKALSDQGGMGVIRPDAGDRIQSLRWRASRSAKLNGYVLRWLRWREDRLGGIVFEVKRA